MNNLFVKIYEYGDSAEAVVQGRIDSGNYMEFLSQLEYIGAEKKLVLDISDVDYISSAGLRAILTLTKKHSAGFRIVNACELIMELFETTGVAKILDIAPSQPNVGKDEGEWLKDTFKGILHKKVIKSPKKVFAVYRNESYTWQDIDMISQIIASDLLTQGVKRYSHVAISSEDSINHLCTFFAIQKLGAIAVMLNPSYTPKEISALSKEGDITHFCFGLNACGDERKKYIEAVTSGDTLIKHTYDIGKNVDFRKRYDEYSRIEALFNERFEPDDPAVMIFTSGSTGVSKGALHSYYSMSVGGGQIVKSMGTTDDDRFCHTLPFFHIGGLCFDFMNALFSDAVLYFPDYKENSNIVERMKCIFDTVVKYDCTVFNAVPTTLLSIAGSDFFSYEKIKNIKYIITGSQPITKPQMDFILKSYKDAALAVVYGMTEILPATMVTSNDTEGKIFSTVGKPLESVKVDIVDKSGNPCPVGEAGEIYLSGNQAIACYYKMDIEKQPLSNRGCIKTGDLGFVDKYGYLHLEGRIKDIIIRGGENIVPGEITDAIANLGYISEAYVCGIPDKIMGEKVASAIIMKSGCVFDESKIKNDLKQVISRHKIPSRFVVLKSFPLLSNGKLDKVKLRKIINDEIIA